MPKKNCRFLYGGLEVKSFQNKNLANRVQIDSDKFFKKAGKRKK